MRAPLCVLCNRNGVVRVAVEMDHIIPLNEGGLDHESNLQGLCHACHADKTAAEQLARHRRKASR